MHSVMFYDKIEEEKYSYSWNMSGFKRRLHLKTTQIFLLSELEVEVTIQLLQYLFQENQRLLSYQILSAVKLPLGSFDGTHLMKGILIVYAFSNHRFFGLWALSAQQGGLNIENKQN